MADIYLEPVSFEQKSVLHNLMELCQHDYSEFSGDEINEHGLFGYRYLDHYWTEPDRSPFLVRVASKLAGFALVRTLKIDQVPLYSLAEFFILRKYRGQRIGQQAACQVFDLFPGLWRVHQEAANVPAQIFWHKVIGDYTGGNYAEVSEADWDGPIQEFHSLGEAASEDNLR